MYAKIRITGILEVVTGMHIGGSNAFSAIGAVDSPVIRDAWTNLPMIPGSSLKGKLRTLLVKEAQDGSSLPRRPDDDPWEILRLFGGSRKVNGSIPSSRLIVSDMVLCNREDLYASNVSSLTEVKFENTINRLTAVANPRQIERVVRGSRFPLDIIYEATDETEAKEDMERLAEGLKLLSYDYLGGHGSRGYGKVKFRDLKAEVVVGKLDSAASFHEILKRAEV